MIAEKGSVSKAVVLMIEIGGADTFVREVLAREKFRGEECPRHITSPGNGRVDDFRNNLDWKVDRPGDEAIAMRLFMESNRFASILACKNSYPWFQEHADELS